MALQRTQEPLAVVLGAPEGQIAQTQDLARVAGDAVHGRADTGHVAVEVGRRRLKLGGQQVVDVGR